MIDKQQICLLVYWLFKLGHLDFPVIGALMHLKSKHTERNVVETCLTNQTAFFLTKTSTREIHVWNVQTFYFSIL